MTMATTLSGCPPSVPACVPERPDVWPFDGTPGTLLIVTCVFAACAVALTLALVAMLVAARSNRRPVPRRTLVLGTLLLDLLTITGAWRAWAGYSPYSGLGLAPDASYWQWYDRLAGTGATLVAQVAFTFEVVAALAVVLTVVALWKTVGRVRLAQAR